jgi:hypothetical protein
MMVPFPNDVVGHWLGKHKLDISREAYLDLCDLFTQYNSKDDKGKV